MRARRHSPATGWQIDFSARAMTLAVLLISAVLLCSSARGEMSHYATLDVPGAARTIAFDVNAYGDVVGVYNATCTGSTCSAARGFLWRNDAAAPESVDVPGASMTRVFGINDKGDIVGDFKLGTALSGFVRRAGSAQFVVVRYSDGAFTAPRSDLQDIDEQGTAVGSFDMPSSLYGFTNTIGFIWRSDSFQRVEAPFESTYITILRGIDSRGAVVGCYWTYSPSGNTMHGLAVAPGAKFTSEDFPGSMMSMNWRISRQSYRVGHYVDFDKTTHGYVLTDGEFDKVDFPAAQYTDTRGIADDPGDDGSASDERWARVIVVGSYVDKASRTHGYRATGRIRLEREPDRDHRPDMQVPDDSATPTP